MSSVLTVITFIKSVSGSNTLSCVDTARLDDDEYLDFQYKVFNVSESNLIEEIEENTIMLLAGKFLFNESQLFVSVLFLSFFVNADKKKNQD